MGSFGGHRVVHDLSRVTQLVGGRAGPGTPPRQGSHPHPAEVCSDLAGAGTQGPKPWSHGSPVARYFVLVPPCWPPTQPHLLTAYLSIQAAATMRRWMCFPLESSCAR